MDQNFEAVDSITSAGSLKIAVQWECLLQEEEKCIQFSRKR